MARAGRHAESQRLADQGGVQYSTLWSEDFTDDVLPPKLRRVARRPGTVDARPIHVTPLERRRSARTRRASSANGSPRELQRDKAIMGVFDEGCMGMFNAIIPDHLLHPTGVFKERLSQSALYYETTQVSDDEAAACARGWKSAGCKFHTGPNARDAT